MKSIELIKWASKLKCFEVFNQEKTKINPLKIKTMLRYFNKGFRGINKGVGNNVQFKVSPMRVTKNLMIKIGIWVKEENFSFLIRNI